MSKIMASDEFGFMFQSFGRKLVDGKNKFKSRKIAIKWRFFANKLLKG